MEKYQIALSPNLGLSPADFVAAWNEEAAARTNGETRLVPSTSKGFDPALVNEIVLSVTTGIVGNTLYDLIKAVLAKRGVHTKHTHIEEMTKPDGTRRLVVDIDEP